MLKFAADGPVLFAFLEIQSEIGADDSGTPVWVQVAIEGNYQGYNPPFNLNRAVFQQMVNNLHGHPSFKKGPDGRGNTDVIQWDFEHTSESIDENVAVVGAPAQGWVLDLEIRTGTDGKAQLWALTRWLPLARKYIKDEQYKWASIAFYEHVRDQETGADKGATLTSIAMTNHPFIEGMEALAARRGSRGSIRASYWEAAESAEDALKKIKRELQLPETADIAQVGAEFSKLRQWVTSGGTPVGVNIKDLLGAIRNILNLPALSTEIEVLTEADKLIGRILQEQAVQSGQPAVPAAVPETNTAMVAGGKKQMEFLKVLARMLGLREDSDETVIRAAVEDLVSLRSGVQSALAADKDTTTVLLKAANEVVSLRRTGEERLVALKEALGTKADEDPVSRIAILLKAEKELGELRPQYEAQAKVLEEQENAKAEDEVARALRVHNLPDNAKAALLNYRKSNPDGFAKEFPLPAPEQDHLTQVITTSVTPVSQPQQSNVVNLTMYPGRNDAERMANHILATNPTAKDWSHDRLYDEVHRLRRAQGGR